MIHDVDVFGRTNDDGTAVEFFDNEAIGNALYLFLTSKRGDFLYNPGTGGILDTPLFRTMTSTMLEILRFNIMNAITNFFTPYIKIQSIDIKADKQNRILEIVISYSTSNGNVQNTTVYINADFHTKDFEYTNVEYIGENLLNFCQIKKSDMIGKYLELDPTDDLWKWGQYIFINFSTSDIFFDSILLVCNG